MISISATGHQSFVFDRTSIVKMPKASILRDMRRRFAAADAEPMRQSVFIFSTILMKAQIHHKQSFILAAGQSSSCVGSYSDEWGYTARSRQESLCHHWSGRWYYA
jgi:hypothetical protein